MSAPIPISNRLEYTLEDWEGGRCLTLVGEADYVAVPAMRRLLSELLPAKVPVLIVDLAQVTFMNTPFWAALQVHQQQGRPQSQVVICGMNEALTAAFNLNGVGDEEEDGSRIIVYATREEAMKHASPVKG